MCGIAGIIEFNNNTNQVSAIQNMANSLHRRGPDDEGYIFYNHNIVTSFYGDHSNHSCKNKQLPYIPKTHIDTIKNASSRVAFGFKRLSIIDLSYHAHQPMCDSQKRFWIVFNGEIYNYTEIRNELLAKKYTFYSNSDTEVVLKAYMEWGEKSLEKFNGMFALSILDTLKNEIFLARDRMGIKPLYYMHASNRFIFGSTIKSIIDSKLYKPTINWEGLWQNFTFSIAQRPTTCFSNIVALEPAHYLKINLNSGSISTTRYWDIPTAVQDFSITEKKAAQLLEETLYKSIKYRLQADVEVGTFMSGGIDSTTISAIASKQHSNIKAFTLGFKNKYAEYDEVNEAKATAEMNEIQHIIHSVKPSIVIDNIAEIITAYEEPYHHLPANYAISKIVAENNVKVVLNGLGGDELFAGYHFYNKLKSWRALQCIKPINSLLPQGLNKRLDVAKKMISYNSVAQYYTHFHSTYNDFDNRKLFKNKTFTTLDTLEKQYSNHHTFTDDIEELCFYNLKSYISNHQTRTVDQFTMNFSIEGRFPFLDHHLIELAFKIPSAYKIKNGSQKYILKEVAKKHIAPSCFTMKKKGFGLPLEYWYNNELRDFISDNLNALKNRQLFNNKEINCIAVSKDVRKIWHLVMTELWLQEFF